MSEELINRWRLILGKYSEESFSETGSELTPGQQQMDEALGAIYENKPTVKSGKSNENYADLSESSPALVKWLGEIRDCFPEELVSVIQKDAISRKGLDHLLYEPELLSELEPDIGLAGLLLSLKDQIPEKSKDAVREIIRKVVEKIRFELKDRITRSVNGSLNRFESSSFQQLSNLDWKKTISKNLKNWDEDKKRLIPEKIYFNSRSRKNNEWTVIVSLDQSGSMAESVIYGTVMASIFASLPALETKVLAFDTSCVDLSEECGTDPVDMLLGVRLGGGTDINKSLAFGSQYIHTPAKTVYILITDLFEGGNSKEMLNRIRILVESGVKFITLLSLTDSGIPFYDHKIAAELSAMDIPCFGCTPNKIPDLIYDVLRGNNLKA